MRVRKRKTTFAILGVPPHVVAYVGLPLLLSRTGRQHGWHGGPGLANLVGLLPVGVGAGVLGWAIVSHYRTAPEEAELTVVPRYLVRGGAYGVTRNPMYLGGATVMFGWAIFFGSLPITAVALIYVLGMDRLGIPIEERLLHHAFGEEYDRYRARVPRWLDIRHLRSRG